jgi:predicted dehydrogenase
VRFLVASLGSIGRRHLRNLRRLEPEAEIAVWRRPGSPPVPELNLADRVVHDEDRALAWGADAALVCGPASTHRATGERLAERGTHLFVEKPLCHRLDDADALIGACETSGVLLMIGYNLRFYEPLRRMQQALAGGAVGTPLLAQCSAGQWLPDWRPGADYRSSVSARPELGGGVLLELSHEFDYLAWLLGEIVDVTALTGRLGGLGLEVEDAAALALRFRSGALATLLLDMLRRPASRGLRVMGTLGTLEWDAREHAIRLGTADGTWREVFRGSEGALAASYEAELSHFLERVREGQPPIVGGREGRRALALALAARESGGHGAPGSNSSREP